MNTRLNVIVDSADVYKRQMVDRDDDVALGLKSTALLFGDMDRVIIGAMQGLMLFGLVLVGRTAQLGSAYWLSLIGVVALFAYQQWLAKDRDRDRCFRAFLNNHYVGMLIFVGIAVDLWPR